MDMEEVMMDMVTMEEEELEEVVVAEVVVEEAMEMTMEMIKRTKRIRRTRRTRKRTKRKKIEKTTPAMAREADAGAGELHPVPVLLGHLHLVLRDPAAVHHIADMADIADTAEIRVG